MVSRSFFGVARDGKLWKQFCFQNSHIKFWEKHINFLSKTPLPIPEPRALELQRRVARSITGAANSRRDDGGGNSSAHQKVSKARTKHRRSTADWDPSYPSEKADWYEEYVARHASLSTHWLQQPSTGSGVAKEKHEARGISLKKNGYGNIVVAPLDDGSVCLWNVRQDDDVAHVENGRVLARSEPGLLTNKISEGNTGKCIALSKSHFAGPGSVDCVSIDRTSNKAYFAWQSYLNEVDLETLQLTAQEKYPFLISALSEASYPIPLTVGTTIGLHLYDPRVPRNAPSGAEGSDQLDSSANFPVIIQTGRDLSRSEAPHSIPDYAPLSRPGPLSILHLPGPDGVHDAANGEIYVAGRFPSILAYDRRKFPKLHNTIYSGARLCALASIGAPLQGRCPIPSTLLACGEYNGKGSLELYPLPTMIPPLATNPAPPTPTKSLPFIKNRTSASSSKLLSVIPHGTRLLFSDSNGMLKWVERDGSTVVRRWNVNQSAFDGECAVQASQGQLVPHSNTRAVLSEKAGGDVARKILSMGSSARDPVAIWTGERIGVVGFGKQSRFAWQAESDEERASLEQEQGEVFAERMRRALERQADEARFLSGLGLPG